MEIKPYGEKAYRFITSPIESDSRITILSGSVRSSKTWAMMPKILQYCDVKNEAIPKGLRVITGTSKDSVYDNVLRDLFELVGESAYRYDRTNGNLRIFDSAWKVIGAKDEGSERYLRGKTIAVAFPDELTTMPESFFRQLLNRLSPPGAKLYATTNPDSPYHYLYKDFIANKEINECGSGLVRTYHFTLNDNPHISEEYKEFIRRAHSGVFFQRFVQGLWVVAEGLIYRDCWNEEENTFDDDEVPPGLFHDYEARYIGVDYGTVNPQVYLDVIDYRDTLYIHREYYFDSSEERCQKTDSQYADDFEQFADWNNQKFNCEVIIDPSAASFSAELRNRGFLVLDADNSVIPGIRAVSNLMGRREIKIHRRNCPHFLAERATYAWDTAAAKRGDEKPIKTNDHTQDTLRYLVKTKIPQYRLLGV